MTTSTTSQSRQIDDDEPTEAVLAAGTRFRGSCDGWRPTIAAS
jgi:hypothetical protein